MLTTTEAAALLTERGMTARDGGPVKPDTVKHRCQAGRYPGARLIKRGPGRGYWLIPQADLDAPALPTAPIPAVSRYTTPQ